jgi:hypothetical protein
VTSGGFRYEPYHWRGTTEWMLVHGASNTDQVILIPSLFEEMNFLRGFIVDIARALLARGIGSWLPDLPATGESLRPLRDTSWADWRSAIRAAGEAVAAHAGVRPHVASFRGGALLGDAVDARSWWSYAPATGASLLRRLERARLISEMENDVEEAEQPEYLYAGYELSAAMLNDLQSAAEAPVGGPHRTVPAGGGTPLWHRIEPGRDPELSALLADDIADWIATCDGR